MSFVRAVVLLFFSGCAIGWSAVPEFQASTLLSAALEGRGEVLAAAGSKSSRAFVSLAGGGGARFSGGAYGLISPGLGLEFLRENRLAFAVNYTARLGPAGAVHGLSTSTTFLFRLAETGGEKGFLAIGPRLRLEAMVFPGELIVGGLSLGVELRWVAFDTTGNSWSY